MKFGKYAICSRSQLRQLDSQIISRCGILTQAFYLI